MMAVDFVEEYAMAAEISEAEALEPRTLAEVKGRPDGRKQFRKSWHS
jgi:hypothetical protein